MYPQLLNQLDEIRKKYIIIPTGPKFFVLKNDNHTNTSFLWTVQCFDVRNVSPFHPITRLPTVFRAISLSKQSDGSTSSIATGRTRYSPHIFTEVNQRHQFGATSFTDELGDWTLRTWRTIESPISEVGIKSFRPRARVSP